MPKESDQAEKDGAAKAKEEGTLRRDWPDIGYSAVATIKPSENHPPMRAEYQVYSIGGVLESGAILWRCEGSPV